MFAVPCVVESHLSVDMALCGRLQALLSQGPVQLPSARDSVGGLAGLARSLSGVDRAGPDSVPTTGLPLGPMGLHGAATRSGGRAPVC